MRIEIVERINHRGRDLEPGRLMRVDPASIPAFKKMYGNSIRVYKNWPEVPAEYDEDEPKIKKSKVKNEKTDTDE